jgi:hypothetical protein
MRSVRRNLTKLNNMEKPKLCVDCRWCVVQTFEHGIGYACSHQVSIDSKGVVSSVDLVTGEEISIFERARMCGTMREFGSDLCGHDAKLWEAE